MNRKIARKKDRNSINKQMSKIKKQSKALGLDGINDLIDKMEEISNRIDSNQKHTNNKQNKSINHHESMIDEMEKIANRP